MNEELESDLFCVTEEEAGERLDKLLADHYRGQQSRSYFQRLIDDRHVLLNGQPVKKRIKPSAGDEVEVQFVVTEELDLLPEAIPLDILYEDDAIIVVNKAAGMVVHPAPGNWNGTFVNALIYHCKDSDIVSTRSETIRPGIVHRLDKETSGVLIAAKTMQAQQKLVSQFASRQVDKEYLAICVGNPGNGEVNAPIGRHWSDRKKMTVRDDGRPAITRYRTLDAHGQLSVVELELLTGRTHQIRVHMRYLNAPVLGDKIYGNLHANKKYHAERQLLHAYRLRLNHPISGKPMEFVAPIPHEIRAFIDKIKAKRCAS
ncbi:MAG: RluA family pseudouridine synthase [Chlamydiales bacterium]|nr:RluA family pseudouridine synthase [Chlamydiia bacterium]MCP5506962.1 RluA family pseudouridine synthase [Chlamydiales bacterium]